jgi:GT2 family glycosyltransferase
MDPEHLTPTTPEEISVVIVSYNARPYLLRCMRSLAGKGLELIVVDNASTDGSAGLVRDRFPEARVIVLDENRGFGTANNEGMKLATNRYVLLLNPDAWPLGLGIEKLASFAGDRPRAGAVGPRLLDADGSVQQSVRGYPTRWRLATEYFFLRWLAPSTRALNAFYAANFDHLRETQAEFLVGAALMVRREAFDEVGGFDPSFFMYNEEVDLCYRLRKAGWTVEFCPDSEFAHVGGASTQTAPVAMYCEQLRSHLRFLAKHETRTHAEQARKLLIGAMLVRSVLFWPGQRSATSRAALAWLRSGRVEDLL